MHNSSIQTSSIELARTSAVDRSTAQFPRHLVPLRPLIILGRHDAPPRTLLNRLPGPPPFNLTHAGRLVGPIGTKHERFGVRVDLDPARLLELLAVAVVQVVHAAGRRSTSASATNHPGTTPGKYVW